MEQVQEADRPFAVFLFAEWFEHCPCDVCIFIWHDPPAQQDPDWQQIIPGFCNVICRSIGKVMAARISAIAV